MQDPTTQPDTTWSLFGKAALQALNTLPLTNIGLYFTIVGIAIFIVGVMQNTGFMHKLYNLMKFFLYSEQDSDSKYNEKIIELELRLDSINKILKTSNTDVLQKSIADELELQLKRDLPKIIANKLEEINALENFITDGTKKIIEDSVAAFLTKQEPAKLLLDRNDLLRSEERMKRRDILETTIQDQTRSSGRLKAVMINLFVVFNFGIIATYVFGDSSLTEKAITTIIGLYISLAAFIVYIYRSSNFRSSVLLALREDAKKYFDADEYIRRLKPGSSPTERDVEVLKLLLLNRAEREKMADHPYELILKGVSNSNIQLKGGKMINASKTEKQ